jgi:hypothetical protein
MTHIPTNLTNKNQSDTPTAHCDFVSNLWDLSARVRLTPDMTREPSTRTQPAGRLLIHLSRLPATATHKAQRLTNTAPMLETGAMAGERARHSWLFEYQYKTLPFLKLLGPLGLIGQQDMLVL